jgi:hypothetical protein
MGSGDAVALQIPAEDREFLRRLFEMARDGIRDELADYPVRDLAELNDRENEHARVVAEHAALCGLYEQLGGGGGR